MLDFWRTCFCRLAGAERRRTGKKVAFAVLYQQALGEIPLLKLLMVGRGGLLYKSTYDRAMQRLLFAWVHAFLLPAIVGRTRKT